MLAFASGFSHISRVMRDEKFVVADLVDANLRFFFAPVSASGQSHCQLCYAWNDVLVSSCARCHKKE